MWDAKLKLNPNEIFVAYQISHSTLYEVNPIYTNVWVHRYIKSQLWTYLCCPKTSSSFLLCKHKRCSGINTNWAKPYVGFKDPICASKLSRAMFELRQITKIRLKHFFNYFIVGQWPTQRYRNRGDRMLNSYVVSVCVNVNRIARVRKITLSSLLYVLCNTSYKYIIFHKLISYVHVYWTGESK